MFFFPHLFLRDKADVVCVRFLPISLSPGAFNLIVISSISILVIPTGETRRIKQYAVFVVTMFWSLFAYFWLFFILVMNSRDRVGSMVVVMMMMIVIITGEFISVNRLKML